MKKLILSICLFGITAAYAQQQVPQPRAPKPVMILLPDSSNLIQLQQVLQFSYQYLPKSEAPANQVTSILPVIQQLYPLLVPMKQEEPVKVPPAKKRQ